MPGWTRRSYGQRPQITKPSVALEEFVLAAEQDNERMIQRVQSSGDMLLDLAVDEKVSEGVSDRCAGRTLHLPGPGAVQRDTSGRAKALHLGDARWSGGGNLEADR